MKISEQNKNAAIEFVKELFRVALIAIIPIVTVGLENGNLDWKVVGTAGLIAILKAIDKGVHKSDKKSNGIVPF